MFDEAMLAVYDADWRTERRAGVEHCVTGQHRVFAVDDPAAVSEDGVPLVALLAYVPVMGHSVIVLLIHREGGEWGTTGYAFHIRCLRPGLEKLPDDFALSEKMLAALEDWRTRR